MNNLKEKMNKLIKDTKSQVLKKEKIILEMVQFNYNPKQGSSTTDVHITSKPFLDFTK